MTLEARVKVHDPATGGAAAFDLTAPTAPHVEISKDRGEELVSGNYRP